MIKSGKIHYLILAILSLFYFIFLLYYYPSLPERIASHFNISGEADGWMSKESFLVLMIVIFIFVNGSLLGITFLIKYSNDFINLPNKEYYLNPVRKETTLKTINNFLMIINNLTITLMILINYLVINSNIGKSDKLSSSFIYIIAVYLLTIIIVVIKMYSYFKKPVNVL